MGNRMTGQRNVFEHTKSQLEQYRGQADTCREQVHSSQSSKNIMDRKLRAGTEEAVDAAF